MIKPYLAIRLAVGSLTRNHKVVLVLQAYFDDSGKSTTPDERVVTVAGCVSSVEMWESFEYEWSAFLKEYGINLLHMNEFNHSRGDFSGWNKPKREKFMSEAIDIIDKNIYAFTGAALLMSDWHRLPADKKEELRDPYYVCFRLCVYEAVAQTYEHGDDEKVQVIFEEQRKQMGHASELYDLCEQEYSQCEEEGCIENKCSGTKCWAKRLGGHAFRKKTEAVQLQTADLVAYEIRRYVMSGRPFQGELTIDDSVKPKGMRWPLWQILLRKPQRSFFHFLGYEALRNHFG